MEISDEQVGNSWFFLGLALVTMLILLVCMFGRCCYVEGRLTENARHE